MSGVPLSLHCYVPAASARFAAQPPSLRNGFAAPTSANANMQKQKVISPYFFKILSYILIALFMLASSVASMRFMFFKTNKLSIEQYADSCVKVTDGYTEALFSALKAEVYALEAIEIPENLTEQSKEEIQEFLQKKSQALFKDFSALYFVDNDGIALTASGKSANVQNRTYFTALFENGRESYFSDLLRSKFDYMPVYICGIPLKNSDGKVSGALCAAVSITTINDILDDIEINKSGNILIQNTEGRIIAHPKGDWIGKVFSEDTIRFSFDDEDAITPISEIFEKTSKNPNLLYIFSKQIHDTDWIVCYCVPAVTFQKIMKAQNKTQNFVVIFSVIVAIALILLEMKITNILYKKQMIDTYFDPLTHLMTRQRFEKEAGHLLEKYPESRFVVIEANIRGFKFYNQNYGEERANDMLIFLSRILNKQAVQNKGIMCRGYADNYYSMHRIPNVAQTMKVFTACVDEVNEAGKNYEIPFVTKFGITFYLPKSQAAKNITQRKPTIQDLIGQASFARKSIQDNALHHFAIFDSRLSEKSEEDHYIESHMEKALENNEFFVMYQPKIDLKTEKVIGAEALVRWQNPKLGFMSPEKFIPLFELNDFIIKLDYSVYRQVFAFIKYCLDNNLPVVPISVNMSRNHSKPEKFVADFTAMMNQYDVPAKYVEVELLERSTLYKNTLRDITILLHKKGLKVAMDDFGSGESSLNMLSNIPVDVLKFDRSFLLGSDHKNAVIDEERGNFIKSLVDIGKTLKKHTVFEGVETEEQKDFLKSIHCDAVQGFYYSKPLKREDYIKFLQEHV